MQQKPIGFYYATVLLIALGLFTSVYLFQAHIKNYTDLAYQSFCAISQAINCDTVAQSPWSIFLGLPVSLWGVFAYLFLLIFFFFPVFKANNLARGRVLFFCVISIISVVSTFFAFVSAYKIKSYCLMCVLIYAINLTLFVVSLLAMVRFKSQGFFEALKADIINVYRSGYAKSVISLFFLAIVGFWLFLPKYWIFYEEKRPDNIKFGYLKKTGDPWIGAENPALTIYEYTDYMCFQCMKMHFFLRNLINAHPEKIRLVHINYPLDHKFNPVVVKEEFHEGSGQFALISKFAADRDDFWKINDLLFELARGRGIISLRSVSEMTGLEIEQLVDAVNNDYYKKLLSIDIKRGMLKRVLATPSYVINDIVYTGTIPPEVFKEAGIEW